MSGNAIDPDEQKELGRQLRDDAARNVLKAVRDWEMANRLDPSHHQPEGLMGLETAIITAYQKKVADAKTANDTLTKENTDLTGQVNTLQQQLSAAQANAKDATDLQTEQAALSDLGLDAGGNVVAAPAVDQSAATKQPA